MFICDFCQCIRWDPVQGQWYCALGHDLGPTKCRDLLEIQDENLYDLRGFDIDLETVEEIEF